ELPRTPRRSPWQECSRRNARRVGGSRSRCTSGSRADVPRYVALLRAINVGKRIVKMDRLRAEFEAIGFKNVETLIASGNVLFDSPSKSSAALEKRIEAHLFEALGYEVDTYVRTPTELADVCALRPFADSAEHAASNALYVGFVKTP